VRSISTETTAHVEDGAFLHDVHYGVGDDGALRDLDVKILDVLRACVTSEM